MDNNQIYTTLLEQNKAIGSIQSSIDAMSEKIDTHISSTKAAEARLVLLEQSHQRQQGSTKVWSMVFGAIGGIILTILGAIFHR